MRQAAPFRYRNFPIYLKEDNETFYYAYRGKVRAFKDIKLIKKSINHTIKQWSKEMGYKPHGEKEL